MLNLKDITKIYGDGENAVVALKEVCIAFRSSEFVSVLGHSGCGKTTLLNIVGGLDKYTSGDLFVNGASTKHFKDKDWDAYRNDVIGFVFQNYNLISHISVQENVEMACVLSGVSAKERRSRAIKALSDVGLFDKLNKLPNQLSGGQMQRVAIARAIVNQPKIILADEPTGALDSTTSKQILEILKQLSKDRLVIMVTHNRELANEYSDRIVELVDGKVVADSSPLDDVGAKASVKTNKKKSSKNADKTAVESGVESVDSASGKAKFRPTSMSFFAALSLSLKNLMTKKTRTLITAFAGSIGIIGVALVLAIANGFNIYLDSFQRGSLMSLPIEIPVYYNSLNMDKIQGNGGGSENEADGESLDDYNIKHTNIFTQDYLDYIDNMNTVLFGDDESKYADIVFRYNSLRQVAVRVDYKDKTSPYTEVQNIYSSTPLKFTTVPNNVNFFEKHLSLVAGNYPENANEVMLIMRNNKLSVKTLERLGVVLAEGETVNAEELLAAEIELKILHYDDLFVPVEVKEDGVKNYIHTAASSNYVESESYQEISNSDKVIPLKIVGVVQANSEDEMNMYSNVEGVLMTSLTEEVEHEMVVNSDIATEMREHSYVYVWGDKAPTNSADEEEILKIHYYYGANPMPFKIYIYSSGFEAKEKVVEYLGNYNLDKNSTTRILFVDESKIITFMFSELLNIISIVLVSFSGISLVVSSIMIGIITYVSVIERTKEIGVLRSLGARKKDISRVFLAESMTIGFIAGVIGSLLTFILTFPVNAIVSDIVDVLDRVAVLSFPIVIALVSLSTLLTLIAGSIPAKIASKKDPVVALRTE